MGAAVNDGGGLGGLTGDLQRQVGWGCITEARTDAEEVGTRPGAQVHLTGRTRFSQWGSKSPKAVLTELHTAGGLIPVACGFCHLLLKFWFWPKWSEKWTGPPAQQRDAGSPCPGGSRGPLPMPVQGGGGCAGGWGYKANAGGAGMGGSTGVRGQHWGVGTWNRLLLRRPRPQPCEQRPPRPSLSSSPESLRPLGSRESQAEGTLFL